MKFERIDIQNIKNNLPFVFIRNYSDVYLGKNKEIDLDELIEARFFGENKEIRIFEEDGEFVAISIEKEENDVCITKEYSLRNIMFGQKLTVCQHIDFDEDGQSFVKTSRLVAWEG